MGLRQINRITGIIGKYSDLGMLILVTKKPFYALIQAKIRSIVLKFQIVVLATPVNASLLTGGLLCVEWVAGMAWNTHFLV
jgi:hypothetical protein